MKKVLFFCALSMLPITEGWSMDEDTKPSTKRKMTASQDKALIEEVTYSKLAKKFIEGDRDRLGNGLDFYIGNDYIFSVSPWPWVAGAKTSACFNDFYRFGRINRELPLSDKGGYLTIESMFLNENWESPKLFLKPNHEYNVRVVKIGNYFTVNLIDKRLISR